MKSVVCAVVGDGRFFVVRIEAFQKVGELSNRIKERRASIITGDTADMWLYLARKDNGWLKESDPDAKWLAAGHFPTGILSIMQNGENKMSPLHRVDHAAFGFPDEDDEEAEDGVIHVLVAFPEMNMRDIPRKRHPLRQRRWDKLNAVVDRKKREEAVESDALADLGLCLEDLQRVLDVKNYDQPAKLVPDEMLNVLHGYLNLLAEAYGKFDHENQWLFTFPVIVSICALFDDIRIHANEAVVGDEVSASITFELVLERGDSHVCIVDAKRGIRQGLAQAYVGSEVFAETKMVKNVYSIVTCFTQWVFLKNRDDQTEQSWVVPMSLKNDAPTRESVKDVAGRVYAFLSEIK
ncbi:unnamed protein product [Phytophthora fragariaefolia]|uniref:Unnamed protein product n=1 Tax=Phytophthora fragariaefolia TaxID=1490495 RepID=A0A9W6Y209_9STRA|nr:unnamed protein product [Phytophthora fragariaefolia]